MSIWISRSDVPCEQRGGVVLSSDGRDDAGRWLLVTVLALLLYCLAGTVYKARVYGSSGLETIPHIDCLRRMVISCKACLAPALGSNRYRKTNPHGSFVHDDVEVLDFSRGSLLRGDLEEDVKL
jgi:hypothetical protein